MPRESWNFSGYHGSLHLENHFSYLRTDDGFGEVISYLLLLHKATGHLDTLTAGQATAYLLHDLGKHEGSPLKVWGTVGKTSFSTNVIAMVKAE